MPAERYLAAYRKASQDLARATGLIRQADIGLGDIDVSNAIAALSKAYRSVAHAASCFRMAES